MTQNDQLTIISEKFLNLFQKADKKILKQNLKKTKKDEKNQTK